MMNEKASITNYEKKNLNEFNIVTASSFSLSLSLHFAVRFVHACVCAAYRELK